MKMISRTLIFILPAVMLFACGSESEDADDKKGDDNTTEDTNAVVKNDIPEVKELPKIPHDKTKTAAAQLIAGMPVTSADSALLAIQQQEFYKTHTEFTASSWKTTKESMLDPIKQWCKEKSIGDDRDSTTCFYPLAGPDFLFANTFYPNAQTYILLGLEPRGTFPDFFNMTEDRQKRYFAGIRESMKYLNTRGYFVTQHMSSDFRKGALNGMVHMMMYMMAKTDHSIIDVYPVYLNDKGAEVKIANEDEAPDGSILSIKIEFVHNPNPTTKKSAYYFRIDVSDENLEKKPEFEAFVNSFPSRMSYLKSASCVLFNTDFEKMRQLILTGEKVIQDDTGVPYKHFKKGPFDLSFYGTYTSVIKDLSWCIQRDFIKDLKASPNNTKLPFKISYNGNYDEGVIMYAVRKKEEKPADTSGE
jgi:hypothetical protein